MGKVKWTTESVKKYVEENSECVLISEYQGCAKKIKFRCKCGNPFEALLQHFVHQGKRQFNGCGNKKRPRKYTITYDEIKTEIESESDCQLLTLEKEFYHEVEVNKKSPSRVKLKLLCGQCKENPESHLTPHFSLNDRCCSAVSRTQQFGYGSVGKIYMELNRAFS